jgi:SAM-dependent methyltransferase
MEVIGVDLQPSILRRARQEIERAGLTGSIRVQEGDACRLSFPDASFDAVISNSVIHHLRRRREALSEMARVLRPGGLLLVRDSLPQADAAIVAGSLSRNARESRRPVDRAGLPDPLSLESARNLAAEAGIPADWVRRCGSRHWLLTGRLLIAAGALHEGSCSRTV